MHRPPPTSAAVLAAMLFLGPLAIATSAATPDESIGEARALLEKGRASAAVASLEETLTTTPPDRHADLLDLLRRAYDAAAKEAEAAGQTDTAELYRDNLEILNRKHPEPTQPELNPADAPAPAPSTPGKPALIPNIPAPTTEAPTAPAAPPDRELPAKAAIPDPSPAPATPAPILSPSPIPGPVPAPAPLDVATADAAFRAHRYDEAGRLYAALDRERRLPAARRDHWAYCRWTEVVRRINAKPGTAEEWAAIDAEIQRIRALSPNNWYGEYLRNRAAERTAAGRAGKSNRLVIRGSAPEEPPLKIAPSQVRPAPAQSPTSNSPRKGKDEAVAPAAGPGPDAARPPQRPIAGPVPWQVRETPSFRILHDDPELAEQAAEVAEAARDAQIRRWVGSAPKGPWSPKCDIYLYPTAQVFSQMTGQPEESPGFSTMGMNAGRIIARRINLRVDHPNLLRAILPHEITHVVLADLFPHQQIPRWADEGMAVLSEPANEQHLRAADLDEPLAKGQLFKVDQLMAMDYPEGKFWALYYAQSVSLTRFLVEQGSPAKFVQFVQRAQLNGAETELRRIYKIDGFSDLHERWLAYARARSTEATASAANPDQGSASLSR